LPFNLRNLCKILAGKAIDFPRLLETTFKQAPEAKAAENLTLDLT
jgi:hypothetical protein